jgi:hypothetical protein
VAAALEDTLVSGYQRLAAETPRRRWVADRSTPLYLRTLARTGLRVSRQTVSR